MIKKSPLFIIKLLMINIIASLILSCYPLFNMILNCVVLCAAFGLAYWTNKKAILPAYKFSLAFILPTITFIELIIGILSPSQIQDNWSVIAILCCLAFQYLLTYSVIHISSKSERR